MSKSTINRLFFAAIAAVAIGTVVAIVTALAALAGGAISFDATAGVSVDAGAVAWAMVGFLVAAVIVGAGALAGLASWLGALANTARLPDKTWFAVLLVLGLWSFGFIAMVAYVLAGPDGKRPVTA